MIRNLFGIDRLILEFNKKCLRLFRIYLKVLWCLTKARSGLKNVSRCNFYEIKIHLIVLEISKGSINNLKNYLRLLNNKISSGLKSFNKAHIHDIEIHLIVLEINKRYVNNLIKTRLSRHKIGSNIDVI